jgi:hypothetical protein
MAMNLAPTLRQRFLDANGNPLAGGKLYTYQSGTTTPQATYTDAGGLTANPNPVVADSEGYANVWLNPAFSYKFVLKTSADVDVWSVDNVVGLLTADSVATASLQDLAVTSAKIADDAITSAKLKDSASVDADRAVTTDHVRDSAITRAKLATGAIAKGTFQSKTTTFTAAVTDDGYLCSAASGAYTATLPTAVTCAGKVLFFKKTDSSTNEITIDGNASETIDGAASIKLARQHDYLAIVSDGANWCILHARTTSHYRAWGGGGHGSSSTCIRNYSNDATVGSGLTGARAAGTGLVVTCNEAGLYGYSISEFGSSGGHIGASLNSNQLTTGIASITESHRLGFNVYGSGNTNNQNGQVHMNIGDLFRVHTDSSPDGTGANNTYVRLWKIN